MRVPFVPLPSTWAVLAVAAAAAGCSSVGDFMSGQKVDYKSQSKQTQGLEVPPDLTQLARDSRYQPPAAVVSAAAGASQPRAGDPAAAPATVAVKAIGEMKIERDGAVRWLSVPQTPEQLWPQVRAFWIESGFALAVDNPQIGVLETEWAENRAKLPQDLLRRTLGRVIDNLYDSGERDLFRTRIERTATGSEIYVSHRGLTEQFNDKQLQGELRWQPRPADPQLEAEFLSRLMVRLGSDEATARTALASPAGVQPARARLVPDQPTPTLEYDEGFDRAWRSVGLALDRTGFTVEDRNRTDGLYFVRYVDASAPGSDKRGFFSRIFGSDDEAAEAQRYRIALNRDPQQTRVSVLLADGNPAPGPVGERIVSVLLAELK